MKLRIALGTVAVALVVVVAGCFGGTLWLAFDDDPLVTYGAKPATVDGAGLAATDYREVATSDFYVTQSLAPLIVVDRDVRLRTHVAVYASGADLPTSGTGPGAAEPAAPGNDRSPADTTIDVSDASVVTAISMSAMKLGPLEANPAVHATSPRLLGGSGFVVDYVEGWVPGNVTDVRVENSDRVEVLGKNTRVTTLSARLREDDRSTVDVTMYLTRVTHQGDLVLLLGVYPQSDPDSGTTFLALVEHLEHGD